MKEKANIDIATIKIIYTKYKKQIIYGSIIGISVLVFAVFTLPTVMGFANLSKERAVEAEKLKNLQKNLALLKSLDDTTLDSQFQTVSGALPPDKDFEGILDAIAAASGRSGALLDDYGFSVGSLKDDSSTQGSPLIQLVLSLQATPVQTSAFLKDLLETVPLSEVSSVQQKEGQVEITVLFYYQPPEPSNYTDDRPLAPISSKHLGLINTISSWGSLSTGFTFEESTSSESASPF